MCQTVLRSLRHTASSARAVAPNLSYHVQLCLHELCTGRSLCRVVVKALTNHRRDSRLVGADKRRHARSLLEYPDAVANLKFCVGAHPMPGGAARPDLPHHNPEGVNVCFQANSCAHSEFKIKIEFAYVEPKN
jgi:hypothetical protein